MDDLCGGMYIVYLMVYLCYVGFGAFASFDYFVAFDSAYLITNFHFFFPVTILGYLQ
jgi:hypothetical protein